SAAPPSAAPPSAAPPSAAPPSAAPPSAAAPCAPPLRDEMGIRGALLAELKEVLAKKGMLIETKARPIPASLQAKIAIDLAQAYTPGQPRPADIGVRTEKTMIAPQINMEEILSVISEQFKEVITGLQDEVNVLKQDLSKRDNTLEAIENWLKNISLQKIKFVREVPSEDETKYKPTQIEPTEIEKPKVKASIEGVKSKLEQIVSAKIEKEVEKPKITPISPIKPEIPPVSEEVPEMTSIEDELRVIEELELEAIPGEDIEEEKSLEIKSKIPPEKVEKESKKINIYFLSTIGPGEKRQNLFIDNSKRIMDIKETIGEIYGLAPANFYLSSGGITLEETASLKDYDIDDSDEIIIIPSSTAG
ncbi:MAG: hypothetical protein HWN66_18135, partial [Candidatus Helarchaeota archaeon]|nr:hypothetical protein [Candidatus Helarchaeota archaeon]